jgi:hypothetical protein
LDAVYLWEGFKKVFDHNREHLCSDALAPAGSSQPIADRGDMLFVAAHWFHTDPANKHPVDFNREVPLRALLTSEFDPLVGILGCVRVGELIGQVS